MIRANVAICLDADRERLSGSERSDRKETKLHVSTQSRLQLCDPATVSVSDWFRSGRRTG